MIEGYVRFGFENLNAYRLTYLPRPVEARRARGNCGAGDGVRAVSLLHLRGRGSRAVRAMQGDPRAIVQVIWASGHGIALMITKPYFDWVDRDELVRIQRWDACSRAAEAVIRAGGVALALMILAPTMAEARPLRVLSLTNARTSMSWALAEARLALSSRADDPISWMRQAARGAPGAADAGGSHRVSARRRSPLARGEPRLLAAPISAGRGC